MVVLLGLKTRWPALCLSLLLSGHAVAGGDVHVRGYYRSNGTYVQPHYRSAPDGVFSNNWTTLGNVNPYTGEAGHLAAPPAHNGQASEQVPADTDRSPTRPVRSVAPTNSLTAPISSASPTAGSERSPSTANGAAGSPSRPVVAKPHGSTKSWTPVQSVGLENYQVEASQETANRIRALGYTVDPRGMSLAELLDVESRLRTAQRLKAMGYDADWKASSLMTMLDVESRILAARRLRSLGHNVDWQQRTLMQMIDEESRISSSQRLARKGISIDWRQHSLTDLLRLEMSTAAAKPGY